MHLLRWPLSLSIWFSFDEIVWSYCDVVFEVLEVYVGFSHGLDCFLRLSMRVTLSSQRALAGTQKCRLSIRSGEIHLVEIGISVDSALVNGWVKIAILDAKVKITTSLLPLDDGQDPLLRPLLLLGILQVLVFDWNGLRVAHGSGTLKG